MGVGKHSVSQQAQLGMARTKPRTTRGKMKVEMFPEFVFGVFAYDGAREHMMQLLDGPYAAFAAAIIAVDAVIPQRFRNGRDAAGQSGQTGGIAIGGDTI